MEVWNVFFVLSALFATTVAEWRVADSCGIDGLMCCLTEFLNLVSPAGIQLGEKSLATSCTIGSETILCLEDYEDHCVSSTNKELTASINKTINFINTACHPESQFLKSVSEYEGCFQNASQGFQSCYNNRTVLPVVSYSDDSKWRAECCEYKELRNCAVQAVEDTCGSSPAQMLQEEVMNINGLGLELACGDLFGICEPIKLHLTFGNMTLPQDLVIRMIFAAAILRKLL